MPEVIPPRGLSAERQWYLYEQIRPFAPARIRTQRAHCQLYRSLVAALQLQRRKLKRHLVLLNERERAKREFSIPLSFLCVSLSWPPLIPSLSLSFSLVLSLSLSLSFSRTYVHVRIHFCLFVVFHCLLLTNVLNASVHQQNLVKTSPC